MDKIQHMKGDLQKRNISRKYDMGKNKWEVQGGGQKVLTDSKKLGIMI